MSILLESLNNEGLFRSGAPDYNGPYTIGELFYPETLGTQQNVLSIYKDLSNFDMIWINPAGQLAVQQAGGTTAGSATGPTLVAQTWNAVAMVRASATDLRLFHGTTPDNITQVAAPTVNATGRNNTGLIVGIGFVGGFFVTANGRKRKFFVYPGVLSAAQLQDYFATLATTLPGAYMECPFALHTNLNDISGNARHPTASGTLSTAAEPPADPWDGGAVVDVTGSGSPSSTLSSTASGTSGTVGLIISFVELELPAILSFSGSGTPTSTLSSSVVARALQADFFGVGALTSTLDSSATGAGGMVGDEFTGSGAAAHFISSAAAGVASLAFNASGTPTSTLSSTIVAAGDHELFAGPTVVGVTPPGASTTSREVVWPGSHSDEELSDVAVDDIGILFVATKNQTTAPGTPGTADSAGDTSNFVQVTGTLNNGAGTAGDAGAVRLGARWCRATSHHMRSVIIPDPGEVVMAGMVVVRGCRAEGDPWDAVAIHVVDPASTDILMPGGMTPSLDNTLVVQAALHAIDTTAFASNDLANASLQNLTTLTERSSQTGPGGIGMVIVSGEKLIAGAIDDTTGTWDSSTRSAAVTIVLRPPTPPTDSSGSGTPTDTLSSTAVGVATQSAAHNASGAPTSTLSSSAAGAATRALDVTGSGAVTDSLSSSADGEADATTIGQFDCFGAPVSTLSSDSHGLVWTAPIILFPDRPPPPLVPGQSTRRRPKRILLPEEETEQPKVRHRRKRPEPAPVLEAAPLAELPPAPPAFAPVTFDPMLWASVSAPPVRPQVPVVTQQDLAEEEDFLAQLLDLI